MLKSLTISNFAVVKELEVQFESGLQVITGETGAGKSIIIDALGLILGDRAITMMIRDGEDQATITAEFNCGDICHIIQKELDKIDLEFEDSILEIRREIFRSGKSRAFINDAFVPVNILKSIGGYLVEMHGQNEHQHLLNPQTHSDYLDAFIKEKKLFSEHSKAWGFFSTELKQYQELKKNKEQFIRELELKKYHFQELKKTDPKPDEYEELEKELAILGNSQELAELSDSLASAIYEKDKSVISVLTELKRNLLKIQGIDSQQAELLTEMESAILSLQEIGRTMAVYRDSVPSDPSRLAFVQNRLSDIDHLLKKHALNYDELLDYYENLKAVLQDGHDFDFQISRQEQKLEKARSELGESSKKLNQIRMKYAKIFEKDIESILHKMGMEFAKFHVDFQTVPAENENFIVLDNDRVTVSKNGFDLIEFLIITNPGDSYKPLSLIASGGETSRIMLAIKSVLSDADATPTLIFDEADAGVSGRIARTVGEQIRNLSRHHQVFCITHLPQIASLAQQHFVVEKQFIANRTETIMSRLSPDEKLREIAKLLGAGAISEATLQNAKELLDYS